MRPILEMIGLIAVFICVWLLGFGEGYKAGLKKRNEKKGKTTK